MKLGTPVSGFNAWRDCYGPTGDGGLHDYRYIGDGLIRCPRCTSTQYFTPPPTAAGHRGGSSGPAAGRPSVRRRGLPLRWRVVRALSVILVLTWGLTWLVAPEALTADAMLWGSIEIAGWLPLPGWLGG